LDTWTKKAYDQKFPEWTSEHQKTFKAIKQIITNIDCLTSIDYNLGENIYVTTDASLIETRTVLVVKKSWEKAWIVAFDSSKYILAEHDYSVYEQAILMII